MERETLIWDPSLLHQQTCRIPLTPEAAQALQQIFDTGLCEKMFGTRLMVSQSTASEGDRTGKNLSGGSSTAAAAAAAADIGSSSSGWDGWGMAGGGSARLAAAAGGGGGPGSSSSKGHAAGCSCCRRPEPFVIAAQALTDICVRGKIEGDHIEDIKEFLQASMIPEPGSGSSSSRALDQQLLVSNAQSQFRNRLGKALSDVSQLLAAGIPAGIKRLCKLAQSAVEQSLQEVLQEQCNTRQRLLPDQCSSILAAASDVALATFAKIIVSHLAKVRKYNAQEISSKMQAMCSVLGVKRVSVTETSGFLLPGWTKVSAEAQIAAAAAGDPFKSAAAGKGGTATAAAPAPAAAPAAAPAPAKEEASGESLEDMLAGLKGKFGSSSSSSSRGGRGSSSSSSSRGKQATSMPPGGSSSSSSPDDELDPCMRAYLDASLALAQIHFFGSMPEGALNDVKPYLRLCLQGSVAAHGSSSSSTADRQKRIKQFLQRLRNELNTSLSDVSQQLPKGLPTDVKQSCQAVRSAIEQAAAAVLQDQQLLLPPQQQPDLDDFYFITRQLAKAAIGQILVSQLTGPGAGFDQITAVTQKVMGMLGKDHLTAWTAGSSSSSTRAEGPDPEFLAAVQARAAAADARAQERTAAAAAAMAAGKDQLAAAVTAAAAATAAADAHSEAAAAALAAVKEMLHAGPNTEECLKVPAELHNTSTAAGSLRNTKWGNAAGMARVRDPGNPDRGSSSSSSGGGSNNSSSGGSSNSSGRGSSGSKLAATAKAIRARRTSEGAIVASADAKAAAAAASKAPAKKAAAAAARKAPAKKAAAAAAASVAAPAAALVAAERELTALELRLKFCDPMLYNLPDDLEASPSELAAIRKHRLHTLFGVANTGDALPLHYSWTAFHFAVAGHKVKLVQQLLTIGADPNVAESSANLTPLHLACMGKVTGSRQQKELLNACQDLYTFQDYCRKSGPPNHDLLKLLLDNKADPEARVTSGELRNLTPLHILCCWIPYGSSSSSDGSSSGAYDEAAAAAGVEQQEMCIDTLLTAGADVCAQTSCNGETALTIALNCGCTVAATATLRHFQQHLQYPRECCWASASYKVLVDIVNQRRLIDGVRPLDIALDRGFASRVFWFAVIAFDLLVFGADPVPYAQDPDTLRLHVDDPLPELRPQMLLLNTVQCVHDGHRAWVLWLLLSRGADIWLEQTWPATGETALEMAVRFGDLECVELLVAAGADVSRSKPPLPPLVVAAAQGGHADIVQVLIDAGADFTSWHDPHTKYDIVQSAANNGHLDVVTKLVEAGAPWWLPKGQRSTEGSVWYVPEILAIERPGIKASYVEARLKRVEKEGKQRRKLAADVLAPVLEGTNVVCRAATIAVAERIGLKLVSIGRAAAAASTRAAAAAAAGGQAVAAASTAVVDDIDALAAAIEGAGSAAAAGGNGSSKKSKKKAKQQQKQEQELVPSTSKVPKQEQEQQQQVTLSDAEQQQQQQQPPGTVSNADIQINAGDSLFKRVDKDGKQRRKLAADVSGPTLTATNPEFLAATFAVAESMGLKAISTRCAAAAAAGGQAVAAASKTAVVDDDIDALVAAIEGAGRAVDGGGSKKSKKKARQQQQQHVAQVVDEQQQQQQPAPEHVQQQQQQQMQAPSTLKDSKQRLAPVLEGTTTECCAATVAVAESMGLKAISTGSAAAAAAAGGQAVAAASKTAVVDDIDALVAAIEGAGSAAAAGSSKKNKKKAKQQQQQQQQQPAAQVVSLSQQPAPEPVQQQQKQVPSTLEESNQEQQQQELVTVSDPEQQQQQQLPDIVSDADSEISDGDSLHELLGDVSLEDLYRFAGKQQQQQHQHQQRQSTAKRLSVAARTQRQQQQPKQQEMQQQSQDTSKQQVKTGPQQQRAPDPAASEYEAARIDPVGLLAQLQSDPQANPGNKPQQQQQQQPNTEDGQQVLPQQPQAAAPQEPELQPTATQTASAVESSIDLPAHAQPADTAPAATVAAHTSAAAAAVAIPAAAAPVPTAPTATAAPAGAAAAPAAAAAGYLPVPAAAAAPVPAGLANWRGSLNPIFMYNRPGSSGGSSTAPAPAAAANAAVRQPSVKVGAVQGTAGQQQQRQQQPTVRPLLPALHVHQQASNTAPTVASAAPAAQRQQQQQQSVLLQPPQPTAAAGSNSRHASRSQSPVAAAAAAADPPAGPSASPTLPLAGAAAAAAPQPAATLQQQPAQTTSSTATNGAINQIVDQKVDQKASGGRRTKCIVCMDQKCDVLLLPCKHIILCGSCASQLEGRGALRDCPWCRGPVAQRIKIVMS